MSSEYDSASLRMAAVSGTQSSVPLPTLIFGVEHKVEQRNIAVRLLCVAFLKIQRKHGEGLFVYVDAQVSIGHFQVFINALLNCASDCSFKSINRLERYLLGLHHKCKDSGIYEEKQEGIYGSSHNYILYYVIYLRNRAIISQ